MQNSVISYFEKTYRLYSDKLAVEDKDDSATFGELRNNAIRIGTAIYNKTGKAKVPVFVYLPKNVQMVEAFLGILYAGDFYTPTDVRFPFEKVKGIIDELRPEVIITDSNYINALIDNGVMKDRIINIDDIRVLSNDYASKDRNDIDNVHGSITDTLYYSKTIDTDLAYILFTSGSTGVPKGVGITHRSIIDYIDWAKECFNVNVESRIGNQAPFYFDNSTLDIYLMISTGASLYIVPEQYYSFPAKLMTYVLEKQINTIFWVPSVLINVANADILSKMQVDCLHTILFAGEIMPNKHLNYWRKYIPNALYANLYGPTEITVDCTYYIVDREFEDDEPLPIGKACPNTEVMIIDEDRKLITEPNVKGELCVRGSSLAVGYWGNKEKTDAVFIQNPFNSLYDEKIYCTGDMVHYNSMGEIMYDGRKDYQIKHMGYRIELGEIETAVLGVDGIKEACVKYDSLNKEIILYYVGDIDYALVRKELLKKIPKYMIPTVYNNIEKMPYNDSGKIDRKKLI